MACLGILMIMLFLLMYFVFYHKFKSAIKARVVESAIENLSIIRALGLVNMVLGLCVVIAIGGGPYFMFL